jgi:chromosome segregation ATPase
MRGSCSRPLLSLSNEEIATVRQQLPAVYETVVQYDALYLNAQALLESKEGELSRCIAVGQEVLSQLHAVRQCCNAALEDRDRLLEDNATLTKRIEQEKASSFHAEWKRGLAVLLQSLGLDDGLAVDAAVALRTVHGEVVGLLEGRNRANSEMNELRDTLLKTKADLLVLQSDVARRASQDQRMLDDLERDLQRLQQENIVLREAQSRSAEVGFSDVESLLQEAKHRLQVQEGTYQFELSLLKSNLAALEATNKALSAAKHDAESAAEDVRKRCGELELKCGLYDVTCQGYERRLLSLQQQIEMLSAQPQLSPAGSPRAAIDSVDTCTVSRLRSENDELHSIIEALENETREIHESLASSVASEQKATAQLLDRLQQREQELKHAEAESQRGREELSHSLSQLASRKMLCEQLLLEVSESRRRAEICFSAIGCPIPCLVEMEKVLRALSSDVAAAESRARRWHDESQRAEQRREASEKENLICRHQLTSVSQSIDRLRTELIAADTVVLSARRQLQPKLLRIRQFAGQDLCDSIQDEIGCFGALLQSMEKWSAMVQLEISSTAGFTDDRERSSIIGARASDVCTRVNNLADRVERFAQDESTTRVAQLAKIQERENAIADLEKKYSKLSHELQGQREIVDQLHKEASEWQRTIESSRVSLSETLAANVALKQSLRLQEAKSNELSDFVGQLQRTIDDRRAASKEGADELERRLSREREEHRASMASLFLELQHAKAEVVRLSNALEGASDLSGATIDRLEREVDSLRRRLDDEIKRSSSLQANSQALANMLEVARTEIVELHAAMKAAQERQQDEADEMRAKYISQIEALESRVGELDMAMSIEPLRMAQALPPGSQDHHCKEHELMVIIDQMQSESELLRNRISRLESQLAEAQGSAAADAKENDSLREANALLESRVEAMEADREPLRRRLHQLLVSAGN